MIIHPYEIESTIKKMQDKLMVLCANLDRRRDRRFVMTNSLQTACGVPLEFFPAIDGERVPKWKLAKFPEDTTGSAYAVRLTKRLALRKFLQSKKEFLLYLEDDVVVAEDFDETVEEAMGRGHEMVFLGGGHRLPPLGEGRWRKCQHTFNNHALLFSREGARKALSVLRGWKRGWSDQEFQTAMMDGRIDPWCVDPWVAFQRVASSDNFGNTSCVSIAEVAQPFMTGDDLAVLDAALCFSKLVVEYGSGGSTLHIGSRMQNWGKLWELTQHYEYLFESPGKTAQGGRENPDYQGMAVFRKK